MGTNKIVLRSVDEFMKDYVPTYTPIYPLFMKKKQQYAGEVGDLNFKRIQTVGDIRAKRVTPKDTEIQQVAVQEGSKTFKKYFLANQFQQSTFQNRDGVEEVVKQVLDEHQLQADELFLFGEGTSASNMLNNGLYFSADANYTVESSAEIALDDRLFDFHNKVVTTATKANQVAGQKVIMFFGTDVLPLYNSLYTTGVKAWKAALQEVLGSSYSLIELPSSATPSGANGWICANLDQIKTHFTELPKLMDQGINNENMYVWHNFVMGSMMVEVLAKDAVIRQPVTLETE